MNQMVKNLMTLNQLEFGDENVEFQRFDLTELIRGVLQSMEIVAQQKEARVQFRQKEPVYVWADEFKAEQVVRNYVSNAFNHLDGDRVVDVKLIPLRREGEGDGVQHGRTHPGGGCAPYLGKVLQGTRDLVWEYGGNGIGLSIVKAIMDSFHQKYGVKNYDNGVEFWFELDVK